MSAHLDRAWDLVSRGDLAGAMVSAEKSLELDPDAPEVHNLVGYIHAQEGRAEEAMEAYERAIELDESFVEAMLNAAEVLVFPLGDYDRAVEMIDDALDWVDGEEEEADALLLKVDALLGKGDIEAAKRAAASLPKEPLANVGLTLGIGRARFDVGEIEAAAPFLEKAAAEDPGSADAHYYLGLVHAERRQTREAALCFLRAREVEAAMPPPPGASSPQLFEEAVRSAMAKLAPSASEVVRDALVVVSDLPGPEVVAEGVDPRVLVLLDDLAPEGQAQRAGRVFVYRRNVERSAPPAEIESSIVRAITDEVAFAFPESDAEVGDADDGERTEN